MVTGRLVAGARASAARTRWSRSRCSRGTTSRRCSHRRVTAPEATPTRRTASRAANQRERSCQSCIISTLPAATRPPSAGARSAARPIRPRAGEHRAGRAMVAALAADPEAAAVRVVVEGLADEVGRHVRDATERDTPLIGTGGRTSGDRVRPVPRRRHARRPRHGGRRVPRGAQAGVEADDRLRARDRRQALLGADHQLRARGARGPARRRGRQLPAAPDRAVHVRGAVPGRDATRQGRGDPARAALRRARSGHGSTRAPASLRDRRRRRRRRWRPVPASAAGCGA